MDDDDLVGRTLAGRFRVLRRLGAGGMGTVFVALQERLGREVALKVMSGGHGKQGSASRARFEREARALAQLSHPGIVNIYDFDSDEDGRFFIAMELVPGETLRQRLRAHGRLSFSQSLPIIRAIAAALAAAHKLGVIHRDLKPENVVLVLDESSPVKVLDFGVAKLTGHEGETALTGTGMIVGTPGYVAPEMVLGVATDDPRSDLYALGVLWFEMLAGRGPFVATSAMSLVMMHATKSPPSVRDVAPDCDIPPDGEALIETLLAKEVDKRPAGADALVRLLNALIGAQSPAPSADEMLATTGTEILSRPSEPTGPLQPAQRAEQGSSVERATNAAVAKKAGRPNNNLRAPLTPLVGREQELRELKERLASARLVTIVGTGGAGKSRLSLEVASDALERFVDGVFFVELASILHAIDVVTTVAGAVRAVQAPQQSLAEALLSMCVTSRC